MNNRAFTLLELLIVLGLIVAVLGLGMPAFQRLYVRSSLRAAAQQVQAEMYHTRLDAMKAGKAYVFRYCCGTSEYEILPKDVFDNREKNKIGLGASAVGSFLTDDRAGNSTISDGIASDEIAAVSTYPENSGITEFGTDGGMSSLDKTADVSGMPYQKTLPKGMIFGVSNPALVGAWSVPVLFYPNGRTSQAELSLQSTGRYEFRQDIVLRGLTGTARFKEE
ncbi:hypothetical protein FACS189427_06470 [Planctomycetales bacterium]|nr:hypothetical protein FACS189427_06470 [Planctomycetales bacterium]